VGAINHHPTVLPCKHLVASLTPSHLIELVKLVTPLVLRVSTRGVGMSYGDDDDDTGLTMLHVIQQRKLRRRSTSS